MNSDFEAVIIGGGHNALVAACYLSRAGKKALILEKNQMIGGATQSVYAFAGVPAKLSRYSYLVALLPDQITRDLDLEFETISRSVSSYTPWQDGGILINREFDQSSRDSIDTFVGNGKESSNWARFYGRIAEFARLVFPTMLQPVPSENEIRELVGEDLWREFVIQPLSQTLAEYFADDVVKGIVLTDGLIGTFASATERAANICFLYHLIGNGTGEWRVPKGGMGSLISALEGRARSHGVDIRVNSDVTSLRQIGDLVEVELASGERITAQVALANCSPVTLERLTGIKAPQFRDGSQMKMNMVLSKLPRLRSGVDPKTAFAGTFHINESYSQLESAFAQSASGSIPDVIPAEIYCHTLTDPTILDPSIRDSGYQTMTLFALHTPASLFEKDHDAVKAEITKRILAGLNSYLIDPIESCLAKDTAGEPCLEVKSPLELEGEIDLPRGNIFHGNLEFPWRHSSDNRRWGVETEFDRIFIAGSGALRGGGVSGIPGHNAARAALERI